MLGVDNANKVDTIMAFNFDGNILTCLNIPRNVALSVSEDVPANGSKNLSVLLSEENGDQKVIDAIKETLGIPVHYYAKVKMDAIADVVDFVGGIEYDIPYNMKYEDPAQDLHISLTAGKQVLSGKQVEHLLRFRDRQHPNGDEIRVMTWQSVVKAFLNQAVIGNKIRNLSELYEIATKNIKTNYSLNDLKKDFNNIKNINRNNIIIENIRGRNVTLYSRTGIYRLLNKIEHTSIKTIIVYSLDHLWGDEELHYMLVLKLKSIGANIKCVTEPQYSTYTDDITKECNSILKYLNRLLPSVLSAKMARGRTEKAENGYKPNGRIPLGYKRNQRGNIVIDDKEAEIVKLIFKQYLYCNSLEQLRLYLSEHHITSRQNIPFKRETLRYMLHNDFYIGFVTYGHKKIHGHHKPIVDKRMFDNVQNALSSNRNCTNK